MTYSRIAGIGSYLPEKVLTNKGMEAIVETSDEWIRERTGIAKRHIAADGVMGETLKGMSDQLQEFRIATASNLLGHSVLVPGNLARPDENGEIHGVVDLPSSASTSNIRFTNEQGEILHQVDMGAQPRGLVGFSWLDIPSEILESGDAIRVEAYADTGNGLEAVSPSVFADVLAATTGNGRDGVQLDVRDYGTISAAEVIKFRK